ncbi:MAG: glycosyltransferase family 39 protein [Candidatus Omnitrophota bacterium]
MIEKLSKTFFQRPALIIGLLALVSLISLFTNLGKKSFWEPDEGRYAEISREMVESGDWLTPRQNYIKHFDKPPVTYWLIGSAFKLFGENEFAGHLPLVTLALAGVLAVFFLGKRLFGVRAGFLSAVVLITSLGYPAIARILSTDIILTFAVLYCYLFFVQKRYLLFYLFIALGMMIKGPIIFILTLLPIFAFVMYEKGTLNFKELRLGQGAAIMVLLGLPWYIYEIFLNKSLLKDWLIQQSLHRITNRGEEPFYFFIPVLLALFSPWIFFLWPALQKTLSFKRRAFSENPVKALFLFFWFILPFLFFGCIGKKLVPYILPLLPPLAIITGYMWDKVLANPALLKTKPFSLSFYFLAGCKVIIAAGVIVFLTLGLAHKFDILATRIDMVFLSAILLISANLEILFFKLNKPAKLFASIAVSSLLFFLTAVDVLPKIEATTGRSIKNLAQKIKEDLKPEDKVVNYRCYLKSLPFYLKQRTIVIERQRNIAYEESVEQWQDYLLKDKEDLYNLLSSKEVRIYCLTYTWEFEKILKEYPAPLYPLGKSGKYVLFTNKK